MSDAQGSLDDYKMSLATTFRDVGMAQATDGDHDYVDRALELIYQLSAGDRVTADDIRLDLGASRAMGSVFHRARKAGWIECVGIIESRAVSRRRSAQRVWVRLP